MESSYWKQKATPWVSFVVLAGGVLTAVILFLLVRIEQNTPMLGVDYEMYLEE